MSWKTSSNAARNAPRGFEALVPLTTTRATVRLVNEDAVLAIRSLREELVEDEPAVAVDAIGLQQVLALLAEHLGADARERDLEALDQDLQVQHK
jgi:hypothetical protein